MKEILAQFQQLVKKKRLSHLYLISGPRGVQKMQLALEISKLLLAEYNSGDFDYLLSVGSVPNLTIIESDTATIKKEQIIELQEEFSKTSLIKGPRVYIISEIEKLSNSAANSLLKFMEEPISQNSIGLLTTSNIEVVIPTIKSRAQIVGIKEKSQQELINALRAQGISELDAAIYSTLGSEEVEVNLYLEDVNISLLKDLFLKFVFVINSKDKLMTTVYLESFILFGNRELFQSFLELLLLYFRDSMYITHDIEIYFKSLEKEIKQTNQLLGVEKIDENISLIQTLINKQRFYINIELALADLLTQIEKSR